MIEIFHLKGFLCLAALCSGGTLGLLSLDFLELEIKSLSGTEEEK